MSSPLISPPFTVVAASCDKVIILPEIADTVVPEAILVPDIVSPTDIPVTSATVRALLFTE